MAMKLSGLPWQPEVLPDSLKKSSKSMKLSFHPLLNFAPIAVASSRFRLRKMQSSTGKENPNKKLYTITVL